MSYRIALASSDGVVVNMHFGHANVFQIYDIEEKGYRFIESRSAIPSCELKSHSTSRFDQVLGLLSDSETIFVSQIGKGAAEYLILKGIRVFEAPYAIDDVIQTILSKKLLEGGT